jgi:hypothetical protein
MQLILLLLDAATPQGYTKHEKETPEYEVKSDTNEKHPPPYTPNQLPRNFYFHFLGLYYFIHLFFHGIELLKFI